MVQPDLKLYLDVLVVVLMKYFDSCKRRFIFFFL